MKYSPIIDLRIKHAYYVDGRCADFSVDPSADTLRRLTGCRCLVRSFPDGLQVSTALNEAGQPFVPLTAGQSLTFFLRLANPDFPLFTDRTALDGQPAPLFTTVGTNQPAPIPGQTQAPPQVLKLTTATAPLPTGVFAQIEIRVIPVTGSPPPLQAYEIHFASLPAKWRYYLVSPPAALCEYTVDFGGTAAFDPSTPDATDSVGQSLLTQYGVSARVDCFTSRTPVLSGEGVPSGLRLMRGTDGEALPAPALRSLCRLGDGTPGFFRIVCKT